uniref:Uncharacterized protein n=1 Tax=Ursus americanus TaxID=9643 RepID=A0A452QU82_URSAM
KDFHIELVGHVYLMPVWFQLEKGAEGSLRVPPWLLNPQLSEVAEELRTEGKKAAGHDGPSCKLTQSYLENHGL